MRARNVKWQVSAAVLFLALIYLLFNSPATGAFLLFVPLSLVALAKYCVARIVMQVSAAYLFLAWIYISFNSPATGAFLLFVALSSVALAKNSRLKEEDLRFCVCTRAHYAHISARVM